MASAADTNPAGTSPASAGPVSTGPVSTSPASTGPAGSPESPPSAAPPPERITVEQVAQVAHLARLEVTPQQQAIFAEQLSEVLAYGQEMNALDLDNISPTSHPLPLSNVLREDVVGEVSAREEILAEAPDSESDQFSVPPVLEAS